MAEILIPLAIGTALNLLSNLLAPKKTTPDPDLRMPGSEYKRPIPKGYGRFKVEGNWIAFDTKERCFRIETKGGGKGGGNNTQEKRVYGSMVALFCEGPVSYRKLFVQGVGHGFEGTPDDWINAQFSFFKGTASQSPWSVHQAKVGAENTPAYRKLCIGGLNNSPLADFGNSFPSQFSLLACDDELGENPFLGDVVKSLCIRGGLSEEQIDTTELNNIQIIGFTFAQSNTSYSEAIEQLATVWLFYKTQLTDGTISFRFSDRGNEVPLSIPANNLGAFDSSSSAPFNIEKTIISTTELPATLWMGFYSPDIDYDKDAVSVHCEWATHQNEQTIETNCVLTPGQALTQTTKILQQIWTRRTSFKFSLPPTSGYIDLIVGSLVELPTGEIVQISSLTIGLNFIIECEAHLYNQSGSGSTLSVPSNPRNSNDYNSNIPSSGTNQLKLLDINLAADSDTERGIYAVSKGTNVNILVSTDSGSSYIKISTLPNPGIIADAIGQLISWSDTSIIDTTSTLTIPQAAGLLSSITTSQVTELTQNVAFIGKLISDGSTPRYVGEMVVFKTVTASGSNYILTNWKRGIRGTEYYMSSHGVDEDTFILLKGVGANITRLSTLDQYIGKTLSFQTTNTDWQTTYSDTVPTQLIYRGVSLKPYSPINVNFQYDANSNIVITWVGRNRGNGVIIGEETESYSIDIMNGSSVVRTLSSNNSNVIYSKQNQLTDFGSVQSSLIVNVYKVSTIVGRGYPAYKSGTVAAAGTGAPIINNPSSDSFKASKLINTNYTLLANDNGYWIILDTSAISGASTVTITLSNQLPLGFKAYFVNPKPVSSNDVTIQFIGTSVTFYTTNLLHSDSVGLLYFHGDKWTLNRGELGESGSSGVTSVSVNTGVGIKNTVTNPTTTPLIDLSLDIEAIRHLL